MPEDNSRIEDLLSRLADGLELLLQSPHLDAGIRYDLQDLLDRVKETRGQAESTIMLQIVLPELAKRVSLFLDRVNLSGLPATFLGRVVDELSGLRINYMIGPRATEGEVKDAIVSILRDVESVVASSKPMEAQEPPDIYPTAHPPAASFAHSDGGAFEGWPAEAREGGGEPEPEPGPEPETKQEPETHRPARVVNTGFNEIGTPDDPIDPSQPLEANRDYAFWLEIGAVKAGSIESTPTAVPDSVPAGAILTVALFSFPGELILQESGDVGTVQLTGAGASAVVDQPQVFADKYSGMKIAETRLFFLVRTPAAPGPFRMRCNIYYQHILVQSRIVTGHVGQNPEGGRALDSTLDFNLSHTLDPARLTRMGSNTLSIFINQNPEGTHGFYFEGEQQTKTQATLDGQLLQDLITQARQALRKVAWDSPGPWDDSLPYRYAGPSAPPSFEQDLINLAIRGYMLYDGMINQISGGRKQSDDLRNLMLKPGRVQISSKESARFVVPAALFYDYRLDTQAKSHRVCDAFMNALRAHAALADSPCFLGQCPHRDEMDVVCPGGFWGYRHELGLPVSMEGDGVGEAEPDIEFKDPAGMVVIVSLDKMLVEREPHEKQLRLIRNPLLFTLCEERTKALEAMKNPQAQLIYFYCHGGITDTNTPYLNVGTNEYITPDNLRAYDIQWSTPRPLVFLNGCMTTALEPEKAIEFVSAFVNQAAAAGVIGTEITIFEPLATEFGEKFMGYFLHDCKSIGQSIRLARLALLEQSNPLGLVYIPFALPGLRMVDLAGATATSGPA
jgi:hypothetical protein